MAISLESIETLRERADVSYEEARAALEKFDGNIVEALIYLEKQDKLKPPPPEIFDKSGFWRAINKCLRIGNRTKIVVSKDGSIVLDISLTILIIVTIVLPPLTIIGLLAALFTNHKIRLEKPGASNLPINKTLADMSSAASKVTEKIKDSINKN